ncbi:hypothetical protein KAW64_04170 [bacterium]|nr:hypothetical protein [bacterium]
MRSCVMIVAAVALVAFALPVSADEIFELVAPPRGYDPTWPPDGSGWHGLYPPEIYCTNGVQTDHDDVDGDGNMSFCDNIQIDGVWKHIEWVGPTFTIVRMGEREPILVEPIEGSRQNLYHIIFPPEAFCVMIDTDQPIVEVCQYIVILEPPEFAGEWHVEEIDTNIHTNGGSPVEPSTWSKIKDFFGNLF